LGGDRKITDPIALEKQLLRKRCSETRASLGDNFRLEASKAICSFIMTWEIFRSSQVILAYMPMRTEVDLQSLLALESSKKWLLPRILPAEGNKMDFHVYDPQHLERHAYGMLEPAAESPVVPAEEIQLALVPGLAFDRHGWRLGYGGGYFDRFLGLFRGISLGITFIALLFDNLPHQAHDMPMDYIVSEASIQPSGKFAPSASK
jgi:5-formyltetrahydrofolate cyclo-ligase